MNKKPPMTMEELTKLFKDRAEKRKLEAKGIKRYKIVDGVLVEDDEGDIVKYSQHIIEVEKLKRSKSESYSSTPEVSMREQVLPVDSRYDNNQSYQEYSWRL